MVHSFSAFCSAEHPLSGILGLFSSLLVPGGGSNSCCTFVSLVPGDSTWLVPELELAAGDSDVETCGWRLGLIDANEADVAAWLDVDVCDGAGLSREFANSPLRNKASIRCSLPENPDPVSSHFFRKTIRIREGSIPEERASWTSMEVIMACRLSSVILKRSSDGGGIYKKVPK